MTPRDSKGRFVKVREPTKESITTKTEILAIIAIAVAIFIFGSVVGYHNGYSDGLVDAQPAIYQHGFDAGVQHQINKEKVTDDTSKWQTTDRYCNRVSKNSIWMRCDLEVV